MTRPAMGKIFLHREASAHVLILRTLFKEVKQWVTSGIQSSSGKYYEVTC